MKSQQEKICDGKTDMRIADEKIEGLMRGTEEGERNIQLRQGFGLICPFIIHANTELLLKSRPARKQASS